MNFEWILKGNKLKNRNGSIEMGCDTEGLRYWCRILNCKEDLGGAIKVSIEDEDGLQVSSSAHLHIKKKQPEFLKRLKNITTDEDFMVTFKTQIDDAYQVGLN